MVTTQPKPPTGHTLDQFQQQVGIWADVTFPESTTDTVLSHLTEELLELRGVPKDVIPDILSVIEAYEDRDPRTDDAEEAADIGLLLLHFCYKLGFSLMDEMWAKMLVNRERFWDRTQKAVGGHWKHADPVATTDGTAR